MLVRVGFLEQLEGLQRLQVVLRFQDKTATKGKVTCQPGSCVCQGALPNSWVPMEISRVILEAVPFPMVQVDQREYNKSKWSNGLRHDRRDPFVFSLVHSLVVRAPCIMTCIRVCMTLCAVSETSHEHDYQGCHGCCACHNYTVCVCRLLRHRSLQRRWHTTSSWAWTRFTSSVITSTPCVLSGQFSVRCRYGTGAS